MRGTTHKQPRPFSGAKGLKRCQNNGESENVVLIDVDSYNLDNVIVIDVPENLTKKLRGSNGLKNDKNRPLRTYIYIDDDENPDERHTGAGVDGGSKFDNGASSSRRYGSDAQFAQENVSPVKLSKGKRTYSGRGFNNRNGYSTQSDTGSSGDDGHDCEFMEDSSGKLREQWERASLKRKADTKNDQCAMDTHNDIRVNKNKQKRAEVPNKSNSKETSHEKEGRHRSPVAAVEIRQSCNQHWFSSKKHAYTHSNQHVPQAECSSSNFDASGQVDVGRSKANLPVDKSSVCHDQGWFETDDCSQFGSGHGDEKHEHTPSASSQEENEENDLANAPSMGAGLVESSIIDLREKLKQTDEYKRALEEEWLARQRALTIQAEEAQQLRRLQKRRKAETLRLLDMERRQKQRVEEIRETQKKDEENMNLKELYRTEVRQELNKLEITCHDMASLLRGLGIQVGDGPCPLSHEVRAAYKRALLSFHPDRAAGSDLRQQVEAEEKFKLISRMKDKLLL